MSKEGYVDFDVINQLPSACAKAYPLTLDVRLSIPKDLRKIVVVASASGLSVEKILCDLVEDHNVHNKFQ